MKIIMMTDSMGIGGAESHICVLCKELAKMGYEIVLISSGGIYEKKLLPIGVRHIKLPICSKNPLTVVFERHILSKVIKEEAPDVLHSHSRMSAFIAAPVCKKYGIPLVVTAHAMFSMTPMKAMLSRWGDRTICVSEDIKKLLADTGKCDKNKTAVIENGVELSESLPTKRSVGSKIVFMSRMDRDSSLGAFMLCRAAPYLFERSSEIDITLVGGGECFETVKKEAERANEICKRKIVHTVGDSADPREYLRDADLFVGVSRAALEAMSCGIPTILLGNEGYLGLFGKEKYEKASKSNFCCRREGQASVKKLEEEIVGFFSLGVDERKQYSEYCRDLISKKYSAERMAKRTIDIYSAALDDKKRKKVLICGYYGYGNFGDDAILKSTVSKLSKADRKYEICAMTKKPQKDSVSYGVRCIDRFSLHKVVNEMKRSDVFLLGGGSLMQDKTSFRSLLYYVLISFLSGHFCKKNIMLSNGTGPFLSTVGEKLFLSSLKNFDIISVRDTVSKEYVTDLSKAREVVFFPDPVFTLYPRTENIIVQKYEKNKYFVVSCGPTEELCDYIPLLSEVIDKICRETGLEPVFAIFNDKKDSLATEIIIKHIKNNKCNVIEVNDIDKCINLFANAVLVLGMRYHSLVFSALCGTVPFAFGDDPKMYGFCRDLSLHSPFSAHSGVNDVMLEIYRLLEEREVLEKNISERSRELCNMAEHVFSEISDDRDI